MIVKMLVRGLFFALRVYLLFFIFLQFSDFKLICRELTIYAGLGVVALLDHILAAFFDNFYKYVVPTIILLMPEEYKATINVPPNW